MPQVDIPGLALFLTAFGLLLFLTVFLLLRVMPRVRSEPRQTQIFQGENLLEAHDHGVLLVEVGGRVRKMNSKACQIFNLQDDDIPNLERLARKVYPGDALLSLCASEGRARFILDGRLIEGSSYLISSDQNTLTLISLYFPESSSGFTNNSEKPNSHTLQTFAKLAEAMASSLNLEKTLQAVLENVEKILPTDFMEISVWDSENGIFIPYRFTNFLGVNRQISLAEERYSASEGIYAFLLKSKNALLIADLESNPDLKIVLEPIAGPIRSFLGVALFVGSELVGTLALGSMRPDTFREEELDLITLFSGQAAIAVHNALLYRAEQRRTSELTGLAQLAQAFSSARNPVAVFSRLVESIVPLVPVDILGFLIYNDVHRSLEAQVPFHGLPDQIVEVYKAQVLPGSPAEEILLDQDLLITENASQDENWVKLGLEYIAQAASMRETVLVPLTTGGHMLGYLQASNHTGRSASFGQDEVNLLMIVANQTASIIENATLVHQSRQRALRAEALRRITSLASSVANLDEILQFSIQELARLLRAELGAVFLLVQEKGQLELHKPSIFGSVSSLPDPLSILPIDDPQYHFCVTDSQHSLAIGNISQREQAIIPFYQAIIGHWKIESIIVVPLVMRNQGIGELWFGTIGAAAFDQGDVQLVATAAGQLAGAVERWSLRNQTDETLRRQVDQMEAITRISRELHTSQDLNYLINLIYTEALRITRADCGVVVLFNRDDISSAFPSVRFSVGDLHEDQLSSLEKQVLENGDLLSIADFEGSDFTNAHLGVQSLMISPISYQRRHVGLICLHGKQTNQFNETDIDMLQALAVQAAIALNNAMEYEEQGQKTDLLERKLEAISHSISASRVFKPGQSFERSLTEISHAIQAATNYRAVLISVYDPVTQSLKRVASVGSSTEIWNTLGLIDQSWQSAQQLLLPEYKMGEAYFIPGERFPEKPNSVRADNSSSDIAYTSDYTWQQPDLLLMPIFDTEANPIGLISVDASSDNRHPDIATIEGVELFASQARLIISNAQHNSRLASRMEELERERNRMENAVEISRSNLPVLLRKELENSITLRSLNQRIERVRATLDIAAMTYRQNSTTEVLRSLASGMMTRFAMQFALIAEKSSSGLRLTGTLGNFPPNVNPDALFGQRNPLRQLLQEQSRVPEIGVLLEANLDNRNEWQSCTLLTVLDARSFIGLQLDMGDDHIAGVLVIGQRSIPSFLDEDRRIFAQLAYQVSVGLKNLELLNETRERLKEVDLLLDFSRQLGSLKPADILTSLIENVVQVIQNANSGWAGIWDEKDLAIVPQAVTGYVSNKDILDIRYCLQTDSGEVLDTWTILPLRIFRTGQPERVGEVDFATQYHLSADNLLRYKRATNSKLPISVLLVPLQVGESILGVLVLENFELPDAFSEEDEALASSFSRQATMALENARLYQASEQRAAQLQALTAVSGTITSSLQRSELISSLLEQLNLILPYDTATLWLRSGNQLVVSAATGFTDNEQRLNLSVTIEDSLLFRTMIQTSEPISVGDLRTDLRFPTLVEPVNLSWLGIPLILKSEVTGVIALEKRETDFYTNDYIQAGMAFASQAAVSLENARLYEESIDRAAELNERSLRLGLLNRLSSTLVTSLDFGYILQLTAQQLIDALDASGVAAVMTCETKECILQVELPIRDEVYPQFLPASKLFDHLRETQGIFLTDNVEAEADLSPLWEAFLKSRKAHSLLIVPLISGSSMQGWFWIYRTHGSRYSLPEIELARTMCNQSAIALQNASLFDETRRLTSDLEIRVEERTKELRSEHHNTQTMLHIITELSSSLDMGLVLNRTLGVLNDSLGCEESLILLSHDQVPQYHSGMFLAHLTGENVNDFSVEHQIARHVVQTRQTVLVDRVDEDNRWKNSANPPAFQSALAIALVMGEDVLGTLLLFDRSPNFFLPEQIKLLEATARQIAIALNNAELFKLIRDQSENLGSMLRDQQIESSRSRAILESVADGVLVTDPQDRVTLFNISAEKILSQKSSQVIGKSLDQLPDLIGKAAGEWIQTIQNWSQDPAAYQNVEAFAEQLEMENGRIIAIHLAPVFWRQEYLGSVSIFRDITYEVQVDRLKSEFVANVSHELRTPLTSIKGYVEIMLMGASGVLDPQQEKFLKIVKSNTERLSVLVNELLDISQIEAGRVSSNLRPIDMCELAALVVKEAQTRSEEDQRIMYFEIIAEPDLPFAEGDPERVRQILQGLVTNGYQYTPDEGYVKISIFQIGSEIQVDVKDNGIGIAPEARQRIFERFYRGDDSLVLASAGTGLGLAIAKTLVEMQRGRIWFESSGIKGEGSTFSFTLPVCE